MRLETKTAFYEEFPNFYMFQNEILTHKKFFHKGILDFFEVIFLLCFTHKTKGAISKLYQLLN